ncbi:MAG TPA: cyclic pyranopterin monophosphate synthase MoaC [Acidobacteriota bacterium]|nr:cyclic pyranopterin monophosphate synthase MoaC [Acidobacteriota bacterium]
MGNERLTHLDEQGRARMVDIGDKPASERRAVASGCLVMSASTLDLVLAGKVPKGNVIEVARIAGIQAAKRTAELIPLCHTLPLSHVGVDVEADANGLRVTATASTTAATGVEMEALTAAAIGLLTLYDMCKAIEKGMRVVNLRLEEKTGGRSGTWVRTETEKSASQ